MQLITQLATNQAKFKNFRQEFSTGILLVYILRIVTGAISIFAGYFYFSALLMKLSNTHPYIPLILAVAVLLIIEILSAWLLSKFSKMLFNGNFVRAIVLLIFSIFVFGLSFISSTNGLSSRQSKKVDNTKDIYQLEKQKINNVEAEFQSLILEQKANIKKHTDSPQGWKGNKRVYMTAEQLKQIDYINNEIKTLRTAKNTQLDSIQATTKRELKVNNSAMFGESEKYYNFIAIVLAVSAICNISLQLFYKIVYFEEKSEQAALDKFNEAKNMLFQNLQSSLNNEVYKMANHYQNSMIIENAEPLKQGILQPSQQEKQRLGFLNNANGNPNKPKFTKDNQSKPELTKDNQSKPTNKAPETNEGQNTQTSKESALNANFEGKNTPHARTHLSKYGIAPCKNCKKEFTKNSYNHLYCRPNCRIEYAEIKTGKNLSRFKNL